MKIRLEICLFKTAFILTLKILIKIVKNIIRLPCLQKNV